MEQLSRYMTKKWNKERNKLSGFRGRSGNRSSKVNIVNIVKLFINSSYGGYMLVNQLVDGLNIIMYCKNVIFCMYGL